MTWHFRKEEDHLGQRRRVDEPMESWPRRDGQGTNRDESRLSDCTPGAALRSALDGDVGHR